MPRFGSTLTIFVKDEPKKPRFRVSISGPPKGPKPITFEMEAADGKEVQRNVRRLIATGKLTMEKIDA